jgi:hypothetical protein
MLSKINIGHVMVKVRSAKQKEASRSNGRLAKGATSEEGKHRSSMNALKHGGYANRFVPLGQNPQEYEKYANSMRLHWQPANFQEADLVEQLIGYGWKLRFLPLIESAILSTEMLDYYTFDLRLDFRKTRKLAPKYLLEQAKSSLNKSDELLAISFKRVVNSHQSLLVLEDINTRTFAKYHKVLDRLIECKKRGY